MLDYKTTSLTIHTIGYEGLTLEEFIDVLHAHAVKILVDIRDLPLSRKVGFSKRKLGAELAKAGIEYAHFRSLGAPRSIRHALRDGGDWATYRDEYMKVLRCQEQILKQVTELAERQKTTLMCFERDFSVCHRSLISEYMGALGLISQVKHLHPQKERVVVDVPAI